jgi:hypothetical protein
MLIRQIRGVETWNVVARFPLPSCGPIVEFTFFLDTTRPAVRPAAPAQRLNPRSIQPGGRTLNRTGMGSGAVDTGSLHSSTL